MVEVDKSAYPSNQQYAGREVFHFHCQTAIYHAALNEDDSKMFESEETPPIVSPYCSHYLLILHNLCSAPVELW